MATDSFRSSKFCMVSTCGFGVERAWKEGGGRGGEGGGKREKEVGMVFSHDKLQA